MLKLLRLTPTAREEANARINIIYAITPLHLPHRSGTLVPMTLERTSRPAFARPGTTSTSALSIGQLPELLPIIIAVAVPGPA